MTDHTVGQFPGQHKTVIQRDSGRLAARDGLEIAWRSWTPDTPGGVIIIVHGLAEHGGRYAETSEFFASNGWAVYAPDLRSHGLSANPPRAGRVHVDRFTDYLLDVDALVTLAAERHADLPVYILGHSMGGLITIRYVLSHPGAVNGAIISSPALGTHPDFQPPWFLKLMVGLLSRLAPRLRVDSELDSEAISRDPAVVRAYLEDPLVTNTVSTRWYSEIIRSMKAAHRDALKLQTPMLLMQSGADRLVDPAAPERWAAGTPAGMVEPVLWDGLYHEMFNEPEKDRVRARTLEWLAARDGH